MDFNRDYLLQSPIFAPLHPVIATLKTERFPGLEELNAQLLAHPITVQTGRELRFVEQAAGKLAFEAQYEPRCYLTGEVQTRRDNWHDLLNALVWLTFPKAKAAINARHYRALTASAPQTHSQRGTTRDTNTLLDESGVIVAYADDELAGLLRNFQWRELFWQRRDQVQCSRFDRAFLNEAGGLRTNMGFYLFGHGLYEKSLRPYIGMTGQGLLLAVEQEFFDWSKMQQLAHLDSRVADYLADPGHCLSTGELSPVPLLGVPGWWASNEFATFYDNTAYFRPGRRKSVAKAEFQD